MSSEATDVLVSRETRGPRPDGRGGSTDSVSRETGAPPPGHAAPAVSRETTDHRPTPLARLLLAPIRAYRRVLSPALGARCRYYPSCSAYAEESIRDLGAIRGTVLAVWRVLRCNPFSPGGLDPVSERRFFRGSGQAHTHGEAGTA